MSYQLLMPPKRWNHPPARSHPVEPFLYYYLLCLSLLFLVGYLRWFADWWPINATMYLILILLLPLNSTPQMVGLCPSTRSAPAAPPLQHHFYQCGIPKWWSPKARDRRISLCLCVSYSGAPNPNKGTEHGESAPDAPRLLLTLRERRHQDLGPWRMLPRQ